MNALIAIEVIKALTMLAMQIMKENDITPEAYNKLFEETRAEFLRNDPYNIPEA